MAIAGMEPSQEKAGARWTITQEAFDRFLGSLCDDRERAGDEYERIRGKLILFFQCRGIARCEDQADEAINRVARKLALREEIRDVEYRLEIRNKAKEGERGKYEIRIQSLRQATELDRNRVSAERLFDDADRLRLQATADSRREAIKKYEAALPLFVKSGDRAAEAETLRTLGTVYARLSDFPKAAEHYSKAIEVFRVVGDRRAQAKLHNNFGAGYFYINEPQKSFEQGEQAPGL